ncbi:MAG: DUF4956 domain-containing protein [Acidobacteria bacterium]|nr:DUF4956 domain-containing protein [Acidobacteriota bacterium]
MNESDLGRLIEPMMLVDGGQILTTMLLALVLGVAVALVYRASVPGRVLSPAIPNSLVLLAMVSAMVMMTIGNSVARAFALVGALSIVRFRTRLRTAWDISFVFLSLAVGIGCGVLAYQITLLGTVIISLAILALNVLRLTGMRADCVHTLRCDVAPYEGIETKMNAVLERFVRHRWLVEARSLRFGESLSLRYRIVLRGPEQHGTLLRELAGLEGIERVVIDNGEETAEVEEA